MQVFNATTGALIFEIGPFETPVYSIAFSSVDNYLAVAKRYGSIELRHATTGELLRELTRGPVAADHHEDVMLLPIMTVCTYVASNSELDRIFV